MADFNWQKQTAAKPLFEDLHWSRPENKSLAGRLLIVGGNVNGFKAPANAFGQAIKAGAGVVSVLLPESLKSIVGKSLENTVFIPVNKSGSLSRQALAEVLDYAEKSDLALLAGDFGHNSETAILLESLLEDYTGLVCLTGDAIDPFINSPSKLFERPDTLVVAEVSTFQKLLMKARSTKPLSTSLNLIQIVELLGDLTRDNSLSIITFHQNHFIVSAGGDVSTTESSDHGDWHLKIASYASVWWLQNRSQEFKSLTSAVYDAVSAS